MASEAQDVSVTIVDLVHVGPAPYRQIDDLANGSIIARVQFWSQGFERNETIWHIEDMYY